MNKLSKSKTDLIFALGWLMSFIFGGAAKLAYEFFRAPEWLNSVVVGTFVGLGICFASLMAISSVIIYKSSIRTFSQIIRAILSMLIGIPLFLIGLFVLWKALLNLGQLI